MKVIRDDRTTVEIRCPECGSEDFQEVLECATVVSHITSMCIGDYSSRDYGTTDWYSDGMSYIECAKCNERWDELAFECFVQEYEDENIKS